ncbi:hypothetical protein TBLA_0C04970 [Henningerozyma blattae CBS 6284]|uniref:BolA-like protein n=1 Tax=Henningerozyma blattae (strain ATCC 34711 / CBS 6284 / DSM 70876 / NBRC 10599 / NRRL Y-10934 / UCD 77-7) TaxID=1071380 RepID=I2H1P1_HENB6|nr:hypothetical protein TBLA_0C04970 [Tetrapisispora blattae CBS 6284]CCH60293.1 hypothetical protein TBLA_0C04970 [Tetrapisispora blattae CBS 6284]
MNSTLITPDHLKARLAEAMPELYTAIVTDTSGGCGQSFTLVVVSNAFVGLNRIQRSRLVNQALSAEIAEIHAFSCKCFSEDEWAKQVV